jgi:hypothetical protein
MQLYIRSVLTIRVTLTVGAWTLGNGLLFYWVLPLLFTSSYLMFVFDYLPHRPHMIPYVFNSVIIWAIVNGTGLVKFT